MQSKARVIEKGPPELSSSSPEEFVVTWIGSHSARSTRKTHDHCEASRRPCSEVRSAYQKILRNKPVVNTGGKPQINAGRHKRWRRCNSAPGARRQWAGVAHAGSRSHERAKKYGVSEAPRKGHPFPQPTLALASPSVLAVPDLKNFWSNPEFQPSHVLNCKVGSSDRSSVVISVAGQVTSPQCVELRASLPASVKELSFLCSASPDPLNGM
ncbi:hypothetical protein VTO42DRAFT_7118 [Malbranchea cinnamomea]